MSHYKDDTVDAAKQTWIKETLETRRQARQLLSECSVPEIPNSQSLNPHRYVIALHASILEYYDYVQAKRKKLTEGLDWNDPLDYVVVPQSGRYDAGRTDSWGEYDVSGAIHEVPKKKKPVTPGSLNTEWRVDNEIQIVFELDGGAITHQITKTAYLPPRSSAALLGFFDDCLENLGWLPGAQTIEVTGEDAGVLRPE